MTRKRKVADRETATSQVADSDAVAPTQAMEMFSDDRSAGACTCDAPSERFDECDAAIVTAGMLTVASMMLLYAMCSAYIHASDAAAPAPMAIDLTNESQPAASAASAAPAVSTAPAVPAAPTASYHLTPDASLALTDDHAEPVAALSELSSLVAATGSLSPASDIDRVRFASTAPSASASPAAGVTASPINSPPALRATAERAEKRARRDMAAVDYDTLDPNSTEAASLASAALSQFETFHSRLLSEPRDCLDRFEGTTGNLLTLSRSAIHFGKTQHTTALMVELLALTHFHTQECTRIAELRLAAEGAPDADETSSDEEEEKSGEQPAAAPSRRAPRSRAKATIDLSFWIERNLVHADAIKRSRESQCAQRAAMRRSGECERALRRMSFPLPVTETHTCMCVCVCVHLRRPSLVPQQSSRTSRRTRSHPCRVAPPRAGPTRACRRATRFAQRSRWDSTRASSTRRTERSACTRARLRATERCVRLLHTRVARLGASCRAAQRRAHC